MDIKCDCSEGSQQRIKSDKGNIHFDMCLDCFHELVNEMNVIFLDLLNLKLSDESNMSTLGVLCDQCGEKKVGTFHHTKTLGFEMTKKYATDGKLLGQWVKLKNNYASEYFVCDDCYRESTEKKFYIKSGRDVYISESLDKTVENLYSELEKTEALFTLIPTAVMKRVLMPSLEAKEK